MKFLDNDTFKNPIFAMLKIFFAVYIDLITSVARSCREAGKPNKLYNIAFKI